MDAYGRAYASMAGDPCRLLRRDDAWKQDRQTVKGKGMLARALCGAAYLCIALTTAAAAADTGKRTWDPDLKRWLTEKELGSIDVYLTEEEALKILFPKAQKIHAEELRLTPDQKVQIQDRIGWKFPEESFRAFKAETDGTVDGYAVIQETIGKHRPITYIVGVTPQGKVFDVEIMVYRESKGSEVRRKRFNAQYEGKTAQDTISINKDIINITGATMSVRSVSAGVKRALVLVEEFYLHKNQR